jgi:hypothetical protein
MQTPAGMQVPKQSGPPSVGGPQQVSAPQQPAAQQEEPQHVPPEHGPAVLVKMQPAPSTHSSIVHSLSSLQDTGIPTHIADALQRSEKVQSLPSSHGAAGIGGWMHAPVVALQRSSVQRLPSSMHVVPVPVQVPPVQRSPVVHMLPSLQTIVFGA